QQLVDLLVGGDMDERALAGPQIDPAPGGQPVQRLPDRLAADTEQARQLGLRQVLARLEPTVDHQLHQGLVHRLPQRNRPPDRADNPRFARGLGAYGHSPLPPAVLLVYRLLYAKSGMQTETAPVAGWCAGVRGIPLTWPPAKQIQQRPAVRRSPRYRARV